MSLFSLALWMQVLLVVCCSLEESLELSSIKRSHVLCYSIRLILELLVSLLRLPIRCLAVLRLCKPNHVYEFVGLTRDITQFLDFWTEEEFVMDAAYMATRDELVNERKHNIHSARLQTQLTSTQSDNVRLRRENALLTIRFREIRAERTGLHEDFDRQNEAYGTLSEAAAEERAKILALLAEERECASHSQADLEAANARIRELVAKLRSKEEALAKAKATSKQLADQQQRHSSTISNLVSEVKRYKDRNRELCRTMELKFQALRKQHAFTTRRLLLVTALLHGSCHTLAARFRSALRAKDLALSRWRLLSAQKVETNRKLARYLKHNEDLKEELHQYTHRDDSLEKEALTYRHKYLDSVQARRGTAETFLASYHRVESRYSAMTSNLLSGLLVLWKLNSILSKHLATSNLSVLSMSRELDTANLSVLSLSRELDVANVLLNPKTSEISIQCDPHITPVADVAIQSSPETPSRAFNSVFVQCSSQTPPRVLSSASVQCSSLTPPREFADACTQTLIKSKPLRSVVSPPPVTLPKFAPSDEGDLSFGNFTPRPEDHLDTGLSAPLLLPSPFEDPLVSPSPPPQANPDAGKAHAQLDERLHQLLKKFDALGSVHHAYRELLLEKTRASNVPVVRESSCPGSLSRQGPRSDVSSLAKPGPVSRRESRESIFDRRRSLAVSIHAS